MKIRTDFVTNSSSSSFVLVIRVSLKNGKVLKFRGESGVGEYGEEYYELAAKASPAKLAESSSVQELIEALQASVVEDGVFGDNPREALGEADSLIKGLRSLSSMDEIEKITINGDTYGRGDQHQYKHYTYYMDSGVMTQDIGGDEYIYAEGTGGEIQFYDKGIPGRNYGNAYDKGLRLSNHGYDQDVEPDPEAFELELQRLSELRNEYDELRQRYIGLIQSISFDMEEPDFFRKAFLINSVEDFDLKRSISGLGGTCRYESLKIDYLVIDDNVVEVENPRGNQLEILVTRLRKYTDAAEKCLSGETAREVRFLRMQDLRKCVAGELEKGSPSIEIGLKRWKEEVPFDHVATLDFNGMNFAFVGIAEHWTLQYLGIDKEFRSTHPIKEWTSQMGGNCLPRVTLKCDYVVAGYNAIGQREFETAINYRDSGKAQLKIIPEDEFVRLLNGETIVLTEEMALEMQARAAAVRDKLDEKRIVSEQKQRQKEEAARERQERRRMMIEEREARAVEQKNLREVQRESKLQQKEAEEAAKKERLLREAEERQKKISENVLYRPGEEPANIRKRIEILFPKLDGAYPNKQISGLNKDHKKWGETVTELYRALGYPDSRAFLEAYGYTVVDNKGGRPSANNYDEIINELKRRYPEGSGFSTVSALKVANDDLPLKTLENAAKQLFGMSLGQYLKSLGILS